MQVNSGVMPLDSACSLLKTQSIKVFQMQEYPSVIFRESGKYQMSTFSEG